MGRDAGWVIVGILGGLTPSSEHDSFGICTSSHSLLATAYPPASLVECIMNILSQSTCHSEARIGIVVALVGFEPEGYHPFFSCLVVEAGDF